MRPSLLTQLCLTSTLPISTPLTYSDIITYHFSHSPVYISTPFSIDYCKIPTEIVNLTSHNIPTVPLSQMFNQLVAQPTIARSRPCASSLIPTCRLLIMASMKANSRHRLSTDTQIPLSRCYKIKW